MAAVYLVNYLKYLDKKETSEAKQIIIYILKKVYYENYDLKFVLNKSIY